MFQAGFFNDDCRMEEAAKTVGLVLGLVVFIVITNALLEVARRKYQFDPQSRIIRALAPDGSSAGGQS